MCRQLALRVHDPAPRLAARVRELRPRPSPDHLALQRETLSFPNADNDARIVPLIAATYNEMHLTEMHVKTARSGDT